MLKIKYQIEVSRYVAELKISEAEVDKPAKLKKCQTIDELNAFWNEDEKQAMVTLVIGLMIILGAGVVFFKKRQEKNH